MVFSLNSFAGRVLYISLNSFAVRVPYIFSVGIWIPAGGFDVSAPVAPVIPVISQISLGTFSCFFFSKNA